ncbi:MAG: DUF362 domain-containing protein [Candidatus Eisenbacteria bacterium]|nr:DUF362 domain-containing protein [Candidatus Eisenbacteria bacterium]
MNDLTRRDFLRRAAAVGGAMALSPVALWAEEAAKKAVHPGPLDLCVARWAGDPVPDEETEAMAARLTERAIDALGGMKRFVSRGDVVWIKPNIGWNRAPELAATTNPAVVGSLARLCLDAGAKKVKVGDNPCHPAAEAYRNSGIEGAARAAGAETVFLDEDRFREVKIGGDRLEKWPVYPEILEADLVINVPIAKHHGLSQATLCMKNYMGIVGGRRNAWHQDLPACLTDITAFMKPRLCVLDAVRILTNNGPTGGNPKDVKRTDTVAAGVDVVALDAFGAELLGHRPDRLLTVQAGFRAGLGDIDWRASVLEEIGVS